MPADDTNQPRASEQQSSTSEHLAQSVAKSLRSKADRYLENGRADLALEATRQALDLEQQLRDRKWRSLAYVLLAILTVAILILGISALRPFVPGGTAAPPDAIAELVALVRELLLRPPGTTPPAGRPVLATLLLVGIFVMLGIVLWKIFSDGKSSGLTKALALAIPGIAGAMAIERLTPNAGLTTPWQQIVYAGIWAILICVGVATLAQREGTSKTRAQAMLRAAGAILVLAGVLMLVFLAVMSTRQPPSQDEEKKQTTGGDGTQPTSAAPTSTSLEHLADVVPFPYGEAGVDSPCRVIGDAEGKAFESSLQRAISVVAEASSKSGQSVQSLLLVASTDGDRLRGACLKKFTSNRQLARNRGVEIQKRLAAAGITASATVIATGPFELTTRNVASDRVVSIYGLVARPVGTP
jgi:hypothetical protein